MKDNYYLYVGNAYPHKNLELLLHAADAAGVRVVFVGKDDYFYKRLGIQPETVTDSVLSELYKNARALVFPSLMEGFGLPALEALANNCPVIVSDIPVFHEILGDVPIYFNPKDEDALVACLRHPPLRTKVFQQKAAAIVKKYSWERMAKETLSVYEHSARI
jgi:glycosyltransferase involved in cell wall biosynthesis